MAALGCAGALIAPSGSTPRLNVTAGHGLGSLPVAAQGPISAALGRDDAAYRVLGLRALNPAQHLRVGFSRRGVAVSAGGARLGMTLSAYGYASTLRALGPVAPQASANRVSYSDGGVREWFANGPLGLEQGFDVAARPNAGSGPLTFSLTLSGDLAASLRGGSLLLSGRGAALRYTGLSATDARGRVLRSWLEVAGGRLLIRVDDRGAVYPLRIDPLIQQAELTASDGAKEDQLGYSVAISGNTVVAGAPRAEVGSNAQRGAAYVFVMPASGWASATQTAKLTASNGAPKDELGSSVAVSGATVVAGAPLAMIGGNASQGAAYVFTEPAAGWGSGSQPQHQAAELIANGGEPNDQLGSAVAVSGTAVVAGAPDAMVVHAAQGAAYVFNEPGGGWGSHKSGEEVNQAAELTASDSAAGDLLGRSVAISGTTVVAGAPFAKPAHEFEGEAYVFTEPPGGWGGKGAGEQVEQTTLLLASPGAEGDELGSSAAVSGTTVVAGAPGATVGLNQEQGKAYVFVEPVGGWGSKELDERAKQAAELTASDGAAGDKLGFSVAASGATIVAGAAEASIGANMEQGAAYVFSEPSGGWSGEQHQAAKLTASNGAREDKLGFSVAVSSQTVLAGAPFHKVGANAEQGAAYVFGFPSPTVTISTPVNGATYTQGQAVDAAYSCGAPTGATVTACMGPVANGAAIETGTLGSHSFTVNASDSDGVNASQSVSYTVVAAPVILVVPPAPIVSGLSETARVWREGSALARISRKKPPVGTTFSFTLNEAASVTFTFTRPAGGRKIGKRCVAETKKNEKRKRCTRTVVAGSLTFSAHAGTNKVRFDGRISKHRKLAPGSYTLLVIASASGKISATRALHFTIDEG